MKRISLEFFKLIASGLIFLTSLFFHDNNMVFIILIIFSYIIISYNMYITAFKNIIKGEIFDENLLMIIATIGAFIIGEYDEALMVMWLFNLGEYLSDKAVDNSENSITKLMDLRSDVVNLKVGQKLEVVDIKDVNLGSVFVVKPGEKIPLDGIVLDGNSNIDTSSLTGESLPKHITTGMQILSGCTNLDSILTVKATSTYESSTATKIIELIKNSEDKKTNTEKFITKFCKIYTPLVVVCAFLLVVIPTLLGGNFNDWLYRSLVFLVTSCPCALVISIPLVFFSGIGRASKEGILVKGSNELENLSKVKIIAFDKTGTITKGNFEVQSINSVDNDKNKLLEIAAYSEYYSNHPIAKAIIRKYGNEIKVDRIKKYNELSGKGISVSIDNDNILIGNREFMSDNNVEVTEIDTVGTIIYVVKNKKYIGNIIIADEIKSEAYNLIDSLNKYNIKKYVILSGDNEAIVKDVSSKINVNCYFSKMLPIDKVNKVKELKKLGFTLFVGDGINDAPVMKNADLSISMGGIGSDAAIEASNIVIMTDNLSKISEAINISKRTLKIVKFNIIFALTVKFFFLILGAIGISKIWYAVIADVGVTLLLVLNSLRLIIKRK